MIEFQVPDGYGYVILSSLVGHFATNFYLGGKVMTARKEYDVPYPHMYATPGYHKNADAFNRVQRGHQNMLESAPVFMAMSLVAGME